MSSSRRTRPTFQRFIESEASGGVLLMGSTALALAVANTFLAGAYEEALHARVAGLDLRDWINDGLMTFFFLLGVAIKWNLSVLSPLGLGIVGGLFLGKQIGILSAVYLAKKARIALLPAGASWRQIYGVAALCGIGFTMSLFIGLLAFTDPETEAVLKLSVLAGSLLSVLVGALVLLTVTPAKSTPAT